MITYRDNRAGPLFSSSFIYCCTLPWPLSGSEDTWRLLMVPATISQTRLTEPVIHWPPGRLSDVQHMITHSFHWGAMTGCLIYELHSDVGAQTSITNDVLHPQLFPSTLNACPLIETEVFTSLIADNSCCLRFYQFQWSVSVNMEKNMSVLPYFILLFLTWFESLQLPKGYILCFRLGGIWQRGERVPIVNGTEPKHTPS